MRRFAVALFAAVLAMLAPLGVTAPIAGSSIENQATMNYTDTSSGYNSAIDSNRVDANVLAQEALTLGTGQDVNRAIGAGVALLHRLTNSGNTTSTVVLDYLNLAGDDYDLASLSLAVDGNANGRFDNGETQIASGSTVVLAPGQSIDLLLLGSVPADAPPAGVARLRLDATTQLQSFSESNTDSVSVASGAVVQLSKSASKLTPARGDEVDFTVTASNTGNAASAGIPISIDGVAASAVLLRDIIPANTRFVSLVGPATATALYHRLGDAQHVYTSTPAADPTQIDAVAYAYTALAAGQGIGMTLRVRIDDIAPKTINNTARVYHDDGAGATSTASNDVKLTISSRPASARNFSDPGYSNPSGTASVGATLYMQSIADACNNDPLVMETITVVVTSALTGDIESYIANETAENSGSFTIPSGINTRSSMAFTPVNGNGFVETARGDTLTATMSDCGGMQLSINILIDPAGIVFDSRSNLPLAGATVNLIDVTGNGNGGNAGGPARVFAADAVTPVSATQVTGTDGFYEFPLVAASTYRLAISPPGDYAFPSAVAPGSLPAGRAIDISGSYGGNFIVSAATGAVVIDIPLDSPTGTGILLRKSASRSVAEIADFVDYTVTIKNVSGSTLPEVIVRDSLPAGFAYLPGSARLDANALADPAGGKGPSLAFTIGPLADGGSTTLTYRTRIGPGALQGDGINSARASALLPLPISSNVARAQVRVQGGVFDDKGYILGKIYADCDGDRIQDDGEPGIPGVRIYMEDGSFVISDGEGKYSFYGVQPRTHVLKVDLITLPAGSRLAELSNRNAGDAGSRFVDLKKGELHRADFAIEACTAELIAQIDARRNNMNGSESERAAANALTFDSEPAAAGDPRALPASGLLNQKVGTRTETGTTAATAGAATEAARPAAIADNTLGFVGLSERSEVGVAQINVLVKGMLGANIALLVNGAEIAQERIGTRTLDPALQLQTLAFVGVDLQPGENKLEITQSDNFGNVRERRAATVIAPGKVSRIVIRAPASGTADGQSLSTIRVQLQDESGIVVAARTPVTLESSLGEWLVRDLDPATPGVQVFVADGEGVFDLRSPIDTGNATIRVSSGALQAETAFSFLPALRPLLAVGVIEGVLNLRRLDSSALQPARSQDGFEQELEHFSRESSDGRFQAGARAAVFLKGKVKGEYLLTLGYDSDKDTQERLFRDIQPDQFYPIYGDSSVRGYDAQSTSRLYVRVDKGRSWLLYGDYTTQAKTAAHDLGAYNRSMTGIKEHYETDKVRVNAFASRDSTRQVVDEFRANGTSGPYTLTNSDIIVNSEKVEILVRDRNQPAIILSSVEQQRFSDYELEDFSGRILFRAPVASLDENLNPVSIRVTYEAEQGGSAFWVGGLDAQVDITDSISVGASHVEDENPQDSGSLSSANMTLKLAEKTTLIAEIANSERESIGSGTGERFELRHDGEAFKARIRAGRTEADFDNPSASLSAGREEASARASYRLDERTRLVGEAIHTRDVDSGGRRDGALAGVERSFKHNIKLEAGVRHTRESAAAVDAGLAPDETTSLRAKLSAQVPGMPEATVYGEAEQATDDSEKQLAALGGEYRLNNSGRLYARHELISSVNGPYALDGNQRQNVTVVGLDADYMKDGRAFSEYRVADAIDSRDAEAAMGLRNLWRLGEGLRLNTSVERVHSLSGSAETESTAVTGAIAYTRNPDWKGTARLEFRTSIAADSGLSTLGLAYKLSDNWTFLGRNIFSYTDNKTANIGDKYRDRLQLGVAFRQSKINVLSALARYEFKAEEDESIAPNVSRRVHIVSTHVNVQPKQPLVLSGRYAGKYALEDSGGLSSHYSAHLLSARATYDITAKWDAGLTASSLFSGDFSSTQYGLGAELGRVVKKNLWISAGYNFFGFSDEDLDPSGYTNPGVFMRLRFKFDESLFAGLSD